MKRVSLIVIWLLALAFAWPMVAPLLRGPDSPEARLGELPVLEGGRVKPLDSVARSTLLLFRGKQTIRTEAGTIEAIDWMTDLLLNSEAAHALPVFRIDHPNLVGMLGFEAGTRKYFSYHDLERYLPRIQEQARLINPEAGARNAYEKALNQLFGSLIHYQMLAQTVSPLNFRGPLRRYYEEAVVADPADTGTALMRLRQLENMAQSPLFPVFTEGEWVNPGQRLLQLREQANTLTPEMEVLAELATARVSDDPTAFTEAVDRALAHAPEVRDAHPGMEYYFNHSQPFVTAMTLYILVMLLVFFGWQFSLQTLLQSGFGILLLGLAIHTFGLVLRVFITGYAPVTNLYSSAVFVGWVAVALSAGLEAFQRRGIGSLAAATIGFLSLLVAHHLADSGDTMEKMRAVLNSNFWLSTHVITIVMGYGATFLAGFLGIIYLIHGWTRGGIEKSLQKSFHGMIFGAVCFSLLFSFVGTVLGGIWADQSWGRFWGWDPKENGALMIVLWTTMIIHALRCGMIRTRGLVNLSIGGNIITAWSWFGTNMLGVGLHAYGFMDSAFFWLVLFWISQLLFIVGDALFPVHLRKT